MGGGGIRRLVALVLASACAVALVPAAPGSAGVSYSAYYVGGKDGHPLPHCSMLLDRDGSSPVTYIPHGVGGACFPLAGPTVDVDIRDVTGLPVGGAWEFWRTVYYYDYNESLRSYEEWLIGGTFCGRAFDVPVPPRASYMKVYAGGPYYGLSFCLVQRTSPGVATAGQIVVTFE